MKNFNTIRRIALFCLFGSLPYFQECSPAAATKKDLESFVTEVTAWANTTETKIDALLASISKPDKSIKDIANIDALTLDDSCYEADIPFLSEEGTAAGGAVDLSSI